MLERWIAFKARIDELLPIQTSGGITPKLVRQILKEFVDMVLFSRFGLDEQTFTALIKVEGDVNDALASNEGLVFNFSGLVRLERNGRSLNIWRGQGPVTDYDCYFTIGNSTRPRANGSTKKGDRLRWNGKQAGPLLPTDLLKVSAMVSLSDVEDAKAPIIDTATDEEMLAAMATGPYPKLIPFDSGQGKAILYFYSPRVGIKEVWTFSPTTPRT